MKRKFDSILETIGNTPIVRINKLGPKGVDLYVKTESRNPLGSVKDRLALGVIEDAEQSGKLKPGQTVVEATSGNTGIGLAMVCAAKGYPLVVTMAESFSVERRKLMRFLGAKVIITPAAERGSGMVRKAVELADANGWYLTRQFTNEANADVHSRTTAREIVDAFEGEPLDYWVTGFGTGGTLKGVSRVLAKERPDTKIVVCEPIEAPMLTSGADQERLPDGSTIVSHPSWKPHPLQGWSPDFIPKLAADAAAAGVISRLITISAPDAMHWSRELAQQEGIFCGTSSGGTFAGAMQVARDAKKGETILCMLPDTGERYLSTALFADVAVDMTEEERTISASTPAAQLPPPAA
ncbi:MAG: cysteine synthase A [Gemmatimonadaceae bacterium]